jgi:hypothetical protein
MEIWDIRDPLEVGVAKYNIIVEDELQKNKEDRWLNCNRRVTLGEWFLERSDYGQRKDMV